MDEAAIRREMDIYGRLRQIASPHILVVLDILREAGEYALVTEYADGGSLWDLLGGDGATDETRKPLDEKTVKAIAADVLRRPCRLARAGDRASRHQAAEHPALR